MNSGFNVRIASNCREPLKCFNGLKKSNQIETEEMLIMNTVLNGGNHLYLVVILIRNYSMKMMNQNGL